MGLQQSSLSNEARGEGPRLTRAPSYDGSRQIWSPVTSLVWEHVNALGDRKVGFRARSSNFPTGFDFTWRAFVHVVGPCLTDDETRGSSDITDIRTGLEVGSGNTRSASTSCSRGNGPPRVRAFDPGFEFGLVCRLRASPGLTRANPSCKKPPGRILTDQGWTSNTQDQST